MRSDGATGQSPSGRSVIRNETQIERSFISVNICQVSQKLRVSKKKTSSQYVMLHRIAKRTRITQFALYCTVLRRSA